MAKAKEQALAGQPCYNPFKEKVIEISRPEIGPEAIMPKHQREKSAIAEAAAKVATAFDLLAYLHESGTSDIKMQPARDWLNENGDTTAEGLFREYLDQAEIHGDAPINVGTLRKAGKWLWGNTWEPEQAVLQNPSEEIGRLRGQIANLEGQLTSKGAELTGARQQRDHLQQRVAELSGQVGFLRVGRTPEELATAGVDAGRNVTADIG